MNCPYCGKEMEHGYAAAGAGRPLYWTNKDRKLLPMRGKDVVFLPYPGALEKTEPYAWLCRDCCKVIIDY